MSKTRTLSSTPELPHDLEAEKSLCGALMVDSMYINRCADIVQPSDFWDKRNAIIFDHLGRMAYEHEKIDIVTVTDRLSVSHQLKEIGGRAYLVELTVGTYTAAKAERYAEIVKEKAQLRTLYKLGLGISERAINQESPEQISSYAIAQSMAIGGEAGMRSVLLSDRAVEILKPAEGLPTGFKPLDDKIVCLENGSLNVFAGFTGMGKSTMVDSILDHVTSEMGVRAAIIDLEMTEKQRGHRSMSRGTGIDMQRIRRWSTGENPLTTEEAERCEQALARHRVEYVFRDEIKMMEIYRFLDREVPLGLRLLAVDYIQLVDSDFRMQRRDQEVGYVSRGLKKCAKHFNIPVIAVSQFAKPKDSIEPQGKKGQAARPHIGLMRESGRISEDADVVIFVHRTKLMDGELIVAKNRQGPKGIIYTTFQPDTAQFIERIGSKD